MKTCLPGVLRLGLALILAGAALFTTWLWRRPVDGQESLHKRLAAIQQASAKSQTPCDDFVATKPLVLLILGQSNAANHGELVSAAQPLNMVTVDGRCLKAFDPLPGGTGAGASIWGRLPVAMALLGWQRPLVVGLLAVDASTAFDWTDASGPLPTRLQTLVQHMKAAGLPPVLVLWQQGEADARLLTTRAVYTTRLQQLAGGLSAMGVNARLVLARSTLCRSAASAEIRAAIDDLVRSDKRFVLGPDSDTLSAARYRHDGCHFSADGLAASAAQWAQTLVQLAP